MAGFEEFSFGHSIPAFLKEKGFEIPTQIQQEVIPKYLEGTNVVGIGQTGTGKTLAFALPLVQSLKDQELPKKASQTVRRRCGAPKALIVAPTRELNFQIFSVLKSISHFAKLKVRLLSGGESSEQTRKTLSGAIDILVASPERLMSTWKNKELSLDRIEYFVCDEIDQMLQMGHEKVITELTKILPAPCHWGLFSATFPTKLKKSFTNLFQDKNFTWTKQIDTHQLKKQIFTQNTFVKTEEKGHMLVQFLKKLRGKGIIFANSKGRVTTVETLLKNERLPQKEIITLHGDLEAYERKKILKKILAKEFDILIASDIAARGLDIEGLAWVLNYDLPHTSLFYLHRCGRTGRMNNIGQVYNFVQKTPKETFIVKKINESIKGQTALDLDYIDEQIFQLGKQEKKFRQGHGRPKQKNYSQKVSSKR